MQPADCQWLLAAGDLAGAGGAVAAEREEIPMTQLLTFDPGMSTGIVHGFFKADQPYERMEFWQVEGGLPELRHWLASHPWTLKHSIIVCEKFIPRPAPRSFKLNELEPIRIEGALEALGLDPVWQPPTQMVLAGGDTPAKRKRASDDVLRAMGLWTTGKDVGMKDSNDVNSAQKHAIAYLRNIGHEPTKRFLAGGNDGVPDHEE